MTRRFHTRTALLLCLALCAGVAAHAQRGHGGGGMPTPGGMGFAGHDNLQPSRTGISPSLARPLPQQAHIRTEPLITLPGRWWDDNRTMQTLKLRPEQQQRMDTIFNANKEQLMSLYGNLQHEQQRFVQMPREDLQDETKVFSQIDRIAQARADLEKANFHTLLQIRHEMDPEQLAALDKAIVDSSATN